MAGGLLLPPHSCNFELKFRDYSQFRFRIYKQVTGMRQQPERQAAKTHSAIPHAGMQSAVCTAAAIRKTNTNTNTLYEHEHSIDHCTVLTRLQESRRQDPLRSKVRSPDVQSPESKLQKRELRVPTSLIPSHFPVGQFPVGHCLDLSSYPASPSTHQSSSSVIGSLILIFTFGFWGGGSGRARQNHKAILRFHHIATRQS